MSLPHDALEWQQSLNNKYGQNPYNDKNWHDPYETYNEQNPYDDQNGQNKTIPPTMPIPPPPPPYTPFPEPYMPKKTGFGAWSLNAKIATLFLCCLLIGFVCVIFIGAIGSGKGSINANGISISTRFPSATQTTISSIVPTVASTQQPVTVPTSTTGGAQQNQSSQTTCQAINNNPWCYNFSPGSLIYSPQAAFCDYFTCESTFWVDTSGYVAECTNGRYTHSDGLSGACLQDGGVLQVLYSHPVTTPTPTPLPTPVSTPTPLPTPTDTPIPTPTDTPVPTPTDTPIPTPTDTPTPIPTPGA